MQNLSVTYLLNTDDKTVFYILEYPSTNVPIRSIDFCKKYFLHTFYLSDVGCPHYIVVTENIKTS